MSGTMFIYCLQYACSVAKVDSEIDEVGEKGKTFQPFLGNAVTRFPSLTEQGSQGGFPA